MDQGDKRVKRRLTLGKTSFYKERLREEAGRGTEVLIHVLDLVGVELDLVVVEVEVQRVVERAIGVPVNALIHL